MKKLVIIVCAILGSCAFIGCNNGNGAAESEQKDSIAVENIDSCLTDTITLDVDTVLAE